MGNPMGYRSISSEVLCQEAEKLGLSIQIISSQKNLFFIHGNGRSILFKSTDFGGNSSLGYKLAEDKELSYRLLEKDGFPIAKSVYIPKNDFKGQYVEEKCAGLHFPLVIKPIDEGHGNGVMMNIHTYEELAQKLIISFQTYETMIVQEQARGDEIRVLVMKGAVILALNRIPAHVIGDGKRTIEQLIDLENKTNKLRGTGYEMALSYIKIDTEVVSYLAKHGKHISTVPDNGEYVQLRGNSNLGTGGTLIEVTNKLCEDIKKQCIQVANLFGLEIAGIDILTDDLSLPLKESGGIILEVNATPGIGGYRELTSINPGKEILKRLFF